MITELLPPYTGLAFEAMRELRRGLASSEELVRRVDDVQRPAGYRLVAAFAAEQPGTDEPAAAVAGFRIGENLAWGRHLYIDDLATRASARGRGHASALLAWLQQEAERADCAELHLDSGVGPERAAAHRLYLAHGFRISSHHFAREV